MPIPSVCAVDVNRFIDDNTPRLPEDSGRDTQPTLGFQRVLQRAVFHVQSSGNNEVNGANVLVAIFGEQESQAVFLLTQQGISRLDVVNYISHGISKVHGESEEGAEEHPIQDDVNLEPGAAPAKNPLEAYATNLNEMARQGKIDPLIGRKSEIERMLQILCRRRKNNPLLVGEAGVGKTAIAEGLAKQIEEEKVPEILSGCVVYSLDLGSLVAGTKVPRRLREAPERCAGAAQETAGSHSVYR